MSKGPSLLEAVSSSGDGVLMRDTEKRPCTVGVWHAGVPTLLIEGDFSFARDRLLDFGDFFVGVTALGEGDLSFGDCFAEAAAVGEDLGFGDFFAGVTALGEGDLDFGNCFPGVTALEEGDLAFGDVIPGLAALVEDDLDFGDCFAGVSVLGEEDLAFGEAFLALDGFFVFAGLCTAPVSAFSWSNS